MEYLCENIQGCVLGYTQSDEISLAVVDYKRFDSAAWFDYNIQKCASVAASMATMVFNRIFRSIYDEWYENYMDAWNTSEEDDKYYDAMFKAINTGAMFDARVFNLPKEEVCNYFYWRQLDASRNSIQMVAQAEFPHGVLQNLSCSMLQEKLFSERNINWNDLPTHLKRGSCCIRYLDSEQVSRMRWMIDTDIPLFKGDGRSYIDTLIMQEVLAE